MQSLLFYCLHLLSQFFQLPAIPKLFLLGFTSPKLLSSSSSRSGPWCQSQFFKVLIDLGPHKYCGLLSATGNTDFLLTAIKGFSFPFFSSIYPAFSSQSLLPAAPLFTVLRPVRESSRYFLYLPIMFSQQPRPLPLMHQDPIRSNPDHLRKGSYWLT